MDDELLYQLDDLHVVDDDEHVEEAIQGAGSSEQDHDGPNDMTCAVCLEQIQLENLALIKGCEHMYCLNCILLWSVSRDPAFCPTCKGPFDYLICYRQLDGTLSDFPNEESVVLLKRARWFEEHVAAREGRTKHSADHPGVSTLPAARAPDSDFWLDYDDYEHDDDEIEDYYFSSAAGRARVVLGNRRMGENGFMRSGRKYARPVFNTPPAPPSGSKSAGGAAAASGSKAGGSSSKAGRAVGSSSSHACDGVGSSSSRPIPSGSGSRCSKAIMASSPLMGSSPPLGSSPQLSSSAGKPGRRAKRNARRTAADGESEGSY